MNEYKEQVALVVGNMTDAAERLAATGALVDAGVMSMGVLTIKALWGKLNPAAPAPAETTDAR